MGLDRFARYDAMGDPLVAAQPLASTVVDDAAIGFDPEVWRNHLTVSSTCPNIARYGIRCLARRVTTGRLIASHSTFAASRSSSKSFNWGSFICSGPRLASWCKRAPL